MKTNGRLSLVFEWDEPSQQTKLRVAAQSAPLQVVRAFPTASGATLAHLHNVSGGVLSGDKLDTEVLVGEGAAAQITTTGATRLYRSKIEGQAAQQNFSATVAQDGLLEYLPDSLIPFAGSCYRQHSRIDLANNAGLMWWEILAAGRVACGEHFLYDRLDLELEIWAGTQPLVLERTRLEPASHPISHPARLGQYHYAVSFYICRTGTPAKDWLAWERALAQILTEMSCPATCQWSVSSLAKEGLLVRALSVSSADLMRRLFEIWGWARQQIFGKSCPIPRKVY